MANDGGAMDDEAVDALKQAFAESPLPQPTLHPAPPAAYRPLRRLTIALGLLVAAQLAIALADVGAMVLLRLFLGEPGSTPFAVARVIAKAATPLTRVLYFSSALVFCFWVYRGYRNLVPLGARKLRFTPGWAVGHLFIPLLFLVRVPQVMRDLWIESQPLPPNPTAPLRRRAPLVNLWWATNIGSLVATRFVVGGHMPSTNRAEWMRFNTQVTALLAFQALSCLLYLVVLVGVDRRQREQWDDLVRRQPTPPRDDLLR